MPSPEEPSSATVHAVATMLKADYPDLWERMVRREADFDNLRSDPVAHEIHDLVTETFSLSSVQASEAVIELRRIAVGEAGIPITSGPAND